jgi:hypothetical protein
LFSIYKGRVIDLDVRQAPALARDLIAGDDNQASMESKSFDGVAKDLEELAQWRFGHYPDLIVVESALAPTATVLFGLSPTTVSTSTRSTPGA